MRTVTNVIRILVGVLFIVSGLVKANDPLGLGYKMEEFFEVWNTSLQAGSFFAKDALIRLFQYLHGHSLALSVLMIALEIVAGVALLLGLWRRWVLNGLALLIVFFTFLTAYAFLSGKFRSCGCFGDCLPITPLASFLKDVALVLMIGWLIVFQRYIQPLFSHRANRMLFLLSIVFSFVFQWYMLRFLPAVDCLPYKVGKNIPEGMKIPAGAVPDSFAMKFIYEKDGKRYSFGISEFPSDLASYKFIDREQTLVRKGNAEAPIKGFSLTSDAGDVTEQVLAEPKAVLVFALDFKELNKWMPAFRNWYAQARSKNVPLFVVTPQVAQGKVLFNSAGLPEVVFLSCDNTAVKTAARANPTVMLVEKGTIRDKAAAPKADRILNRL
ncbi:BT_3928 family protein [Flaviaesturariibacter aridisoli]|uniref:DoxX family protein n=1 Tax=Flaviaesturariibacter aridisoli TaxID=2545761 RepID=A0A4R4E1G3_9BACT|nr:BT_3928 family protein [Flaviaesturariibacter aridisoli]TCZ73256.1 DoxX family protein [Flaviaesturariibacter aridisoli]